jgi:adenosine deaminase
MSPHEQKVANYFETLKSNPQLLHIFLRRMPKGGELHYHSEGSTYPEDLIGFLEGSDFYMDIEKKTTTKEHFNAPAHYLGNLRQKFSLYRQMVDEWSLTKSFDDLSEKNHHFFNYFYRAEELIETYRPEFLVDQRQRAEAQNEDYLEMVYIPKLQDNLKLGEGISFTEDFEALFHTFEKAGIQKNVDSIIALTKTTQQKADAIALSSVTVRYIFCGLRIFSPAQVFAQLQAGFLAASQCKDIVGVGLVHAENHPIALKDYDLHMKMLNYFHQKFPAVHIALHAGELCLEVASPNALTDHIEKAVKIGGAKRIGHGVSIAHETRALETLQFMKEKAIAVEILLSSNEHMLNIIGDAHPFRLYLDAGVPIVISSDDEGVFRTDLTTEYYKAVTRYQLDYVTIKAIALNAILCSFLPADEKEELLTRVEQKFEVFEKYVVENF